jgi:hypothetical protein
MRITIVVALAALCGGCAANEVASFQARPGQEAIVRDGRAALVSRAPHSLVMIAPALRQFTASGRPVFVVGLYNLGPSPLLFRVADIQATQTVNGQVAELKVIPYEELVQEEKTRQVAAAILTGVAAGANAYSASRAGYYNSNGTVSGPHGTYLVQTSGYSPTANAIAQENAAAQNEAMISTTIERGQQNLAVLERSVIKDDTIMPGEWYGGQLHLQPLVPAENKEPRTYSVALLVGADRHIINIAQVAVH